MRRVLAIDDHPDNLVSIKALLKSILPNVEVLLAQSGLEGIMIAQNEQPDVILLDVIMPKMDGYEVCKLLKDNDLTSSIPVVMVTALNQGDNNKNKALIIGADAFLSKPLEQADLKAQLNVIFRVKDAESELKQQRDLLAELLKEKEQRLVKSEVNYRSLIENLGVPVVVLQNETIQFSNKYSTQVLGYTPSEMVGKNFKAFFNHDDQQELAESVRLVTKGLDQGVKKDRQVNAKDGSKVWINFTTELIEWKGDKAVLVTINDITSRVNAELKSQKEEERYRSFVSHFQGIAYKMLSSGAYDFVNGNVAEITGYYAEDFIGDVVSFKKMIHANDKGDVNQAVHAFLESESEHIDLEYRIITKNKSIKWVHELITRSKVEKCYYGTIQDISQKVKAAEELIVAKNKAEESDRLKSAFLANMSHEIRTPMNGILGFSQLLKRPNLTKEKQAMYVKIIQESGNRMLNLVNDLIDISRIESGQVELVCSPLNINHQLEQLQHFFMPEVEEKGMNIRLDLPLVDKDARFNIDSEKLYAILSNLTKNAIKYSDKGTVHISYKYNNNRIYYSIKDEGIGIALDRINAVFERFVQADIADTKAFEGAGLGLSIAKAFVELMGGVISVESDLGKGSTFKFFIEAERICNTQ